MALTLPHLRKTFVCLSVLTGLSACGGGSSSNTPEPPPTPVNQAPTITLVEVRESTGDDSVTNGETVTVLVRASDPDGDALSGTLEVDGQTVTLAAYSGSENFALQGEVTLGNFGRLSASLSVSDGSLSVTASESVDVLPNAQDVQDYLSANFLDYDATPKAGADLGTSFDVSTQERLGFVSNDITEAQAMFNIAPAGECGQGNPHYYVPVTTSVDGVATGTIDTVFALECMTSTQSLAMAKMATTNNTQSEAYTAVTYTVVDDSETGVSVTAMGNGIRLEGAIDAVNCGAINVPIDEDAYLWSDNFVADNLSTLFGDGVTSFDYNCTQTKNEQNASLYGVMRGTLTINDSTPPEVTISERSFTQLVEGTPRDIGDICVEFSSSDNDGILSESLTLKAVDDLVDPVQMANVGGRHCTSLLPFSGLTAFIDATATDFTGNVGRALNASFMVDANDAPTITQSSIPEFDVNSGTASLSSFIDVTDPEGDMVNLSSLNVDTNQSAGSYTLNVNGTDEHGAQGESLGVRYSIVNPAPVNTAPVISTQPSNIGVSIGGSININTASNFSCTDQDGDILSYNNSINGSGNYSPNGSPRVENFTITCSDGNGGIITSNSANLYICPSSTNWDGNTGCN